MTIGDETRASDRDRARVVEVLSDQTSQGRLTLTEFEERTAQAYAARTWDELQILVKDLPVRVSFGDEVADLRSVAPAGTGPGPDSAWQAARRLLPYLPYLLLAVAALALAFRLPVAAIVIPILIVGRVVRGGSFRTPRGHRHHHRY